MISSDRMAAVDANAEELGVSTDKLMENAGSSVARIVDREFKNPSVCVVSGLGNNGGDSLVAARFLEADVFLLGRGSQIKTDDSRENWKILEKSELSLFEIDDSSQVDTFDEFDVIIDGILGTGVSGDLREPVSTAVDVINKSSSSVVSVDVPTGVDPDIDSIQEGKKVDADIVVGLHDDKPAYSSLKSKIEIVDIGIPSAAEEFVCRGDLTLISRDPTGHKGDNGKVLIIGGGPYTGAPVLSSLAALRSGCDLVRVATPSPQTAKNFPDLIIDELEGDKLNKENIDKLLTLIDWADSVLIGPGLGDEDETIETIYEIIPHIDSGVFDADAIQALSDIETDREIIITPHSGELSYFIDIPSSFPKRKEAVEDFSKENNLITLLKGPCDIISDGSRTRISRSGNESMTVGGTGDVLAGICVSLFSRMSGFDSACLAAFINGRAGDIARKDMGYSILASDLVDKIPKAMV